ncbi:MAG: TetR/AcrR family transcriptional regulator [Blastocatellia bacterium]|nr:TetR/AcrR family transcriptional regulator [Blastocatellia bacterium]MBK6426207.1 TetR/AcrR family transcriptional regulator [Blastocatellia bacterium]
MTLPIQHHEEIAPRMRADARREQLIGVAVDLFSRKGFSGTTTKEIAAAAGVTEALIFRHFPTKDALYDAILRWRVEKCGTQNWLELLQPLADNRDDDGIIRAVTSGLLEFHRENVDFLRLMFFAVLENHELAQSFRESQIRPIYEFLTNYISLRQREGAFRSLDPGTTVRAIFGAPFYHSIVNNLFHCNMLQVSDEVAVDTFVRLALDGLRTPEDHTEG